MRPGITDPASIAYRREEEILARAADPEELYRCVVLPRKLDLYEAYVATRSCGGDLRILLETTRAVLGRHESTFGPDARDGERGVGPEASSGRPRTGSGGDSPC